MCAALLGLCACATPKTAATQVQVPIAGPFDDALLSAGVEAQLDPSSEPTRLKLLRRSCRANQRLACAVLLRHLDDGDEKTRQYQALKANRDDLGRYGWATLVFETSGAERRQLAREALIKFPGTDLFYSAADYVPQREIGLKTFVDNPTYMTLLALGVGLIREDRWAMLDKAFRMVDFPPELGPYITVRGLSGTVTPRSPAPLKPLR